MSSLFPCPDSLSGCDCSEYPVRNFSTEAPDVPVFIGHADVPPDGPLGYFSPGCQSECYSEISQEDADECAARQAVECAGDPSPPGPPGPVYVNTSATCTVNCPDGSEFSWTVSGGTVAARWQADANAKAHGLACKRANAAKVCFVTTSPLDPICAGVFVSVPIVATGGTPGSGYVFEITAGSLPAGLTFDAVGLISGTPTTGGTSTFTVRVTDSIGSFQVKTFTLRVVQITSPTTLPAAVVGTPYSYTLLKTGTTGTVLWSLISGSLPPGLSVSTSGVISGTPTAGGTYTFRLGLLDGTGASCQKDFTLTSGVTLLGYWTFDDYIINSRILDSTTNDFDIVYSTSDGAIVPGKVGNCFRPDNGAQLNALPASHALFNNVGTTGFTICGWVRLSPADNAGDGFVNYVSWFTPSSDFSLELLNADLVLNVNGGAEQIFYPYPQDGGWHFYRAWYDPADNKARLQIDMGTIMESAVITVGGGSGGSFIFVGNAIFAGATERSLDETGFWKRVLTDAQATAIYNGGVGITFGSPSMPA